MKKLLTLSFLFFALISQGFPEEPIRIIDVKAHRIGDYDQIEVYTSSKISPVVLPLEAHNQIALIFQNSRVDKPFNVPPPSPKIKNIQVVQFSQDTVYVIVELFNEVEYDVTSIIGKNRIILELGREKKKTVPPLKEQVASIEAATAEVAVEKKMPSPVGMPPQALSKSFKIYIAGKLFSSYSRTAIKNDVIMVPARKFFEAVGSASDYNGRTGIFTARVKYEWKLELSPGSRNALLKIVDNENDRFIDKRFIMADPPAFIRTEFRKELYIPLSSVAKILGYDVNWSEDRSKLYVNAKITDAIITESGIVKRISIKTTNSLGEIKKRREDKTIYIDFIGAKLDDNKNPTTIRGKNYDIKLYQLNNLVVTLKVYMKNMLYYTTSEFEEKDTYDIIFAPAITSIEYERLTAGYGKVSIYTSDPVNFEETLYTDPERIRIDLKDTILKVVTPPQADSRSVKGIRFSLSSSDPPVSSVIITLDGGTHKTYFSEDKKKLSIVIKEKPNPVKAIKPYPLKGVTVIVDAGHGGKDPGTIGYSGTLEKDLTLPAALKLCEYLYNGGANVILTREKDLYLNNKEIVQLSNRNNADIFISLHYNAFSSPAAGGTEVYYFTKDSVGLARTIYKSLVRGIKRKGRGIKEVTYYTVHHSKIPAIIVEAMYITNPYEEKLAKSWKYQDMIASSIYRGIKEYFSGTEGSKSR